MTHDEGATPVSTSLIDLAAAFAGGTTDAAAELEAEGAVIAAEEAAANGRTDVHAPKAFNPAEYTEIGYFDNHPEEGGCWVDTAYNDKAYFEGNYQAKGRCDHCGAGPLRYGVVFYHEPTDETLVTGTICAHRLNLGTRSQFEREQLLAEAVVQRKRDEFRVSAPDVAEFLTDALEGGTERFEFVLDVARKLRRYGSLSEKQVAAIRKIIASRAEYAANREPEVIPDAPLYEGRYVIEGEILSHKFQDGFYGEQHKMLVRLDSGCKVWGTMPAILEDRFEVDEPIGARIRFTAAVERSDKDEFFGFFKRPAGAEVLSA